MKVEISRKAAIAFQSLSPENKRRVKVKIKLLEKTTLADLLYADEVKVMDGAASDYIMKVSSNLIMLLSDFGDNVIVMDIIPYHRLKEMYG